MTDVRIHKVRFEPVGIEMEVEENFGQSAVYREAVSSR